MDLVVEHARVFLWGMRRRDRTASVQRKLGKTTQE